MSSSQFHAGLDIVSGAVVFVVMDISARLRGLVSNPSSLFFSAALFTGVFHHNRGLEPAWKVIVAVPSLNVCEAPCKRASFVIGRCISFLFRKLIPKQASKLACLLAWGWYKSIAPPPCEAELALPRFSHILT